MLGYSTFRIAETDMCSSLKGVDSNADKLNWPGGCTGTAYELTVPTVRLDTVIDWLPVDYVEFVKVEWDLFLFYLSISICID